MKSDFDIILQTYNTAPGGVIDNSEPYHKAVIDDIPTYIQNLVGDRYLVKGSCGQGNKAANPWICILDTRVTRTATYGLYVVYLFRSDMTGFYLALSQGITTFEERFGKDRYDVTRKVSARFKRDIADDYFSKAAIDLRSQKGSLGYGYEATTILSKFYPADNYNDEILRSDLEKMLKIYKDIVDNMGDHTYESIMDNVYNNQKDEFVKSDVAIRDIDAAVNGPEEEVAGELILVDTLEPRKKVYRNITTKAPKKIDYFKKAARDAKIGLTGERLVLNYERKRLAKAGRPDLVDSISWVAEENDFLGYDISSFDFDDAGNAHEIHIEVKTTKSKLNDPFFITEAELKAMHANPDNYRIYRVSLGKDRSTVYIIAGSDFKDSFRLTSHNYLAMFKGN